MKNLDEFIKLSHYLKNYALYQSFSEMDERNRRTLSKVEKNLEGSELNHSEEQELSEYKEILSKVDFNNKLLENSFNNYDFSDSTVDQAITDYQLYSYEFITETILNSFENKSYTLEKDNINHIYAAEKVIRKHFYEKFFIPEDFEKILEKAVHNILADRLGWNQETVKEKLKAYF